MKLQSCTKCGEKFGYKQIFRNFLFETHKGLECSHCGKKHTLKRNYMLIITPLMMLSLFIPGTLRLFMHPVNEALLFVLSIGYALAIVALIPYIVNYNKAA